MTDKQSQTLIDDVAEIKRAVIGEPKTGNTGLVKRMAKAETKIRGFELKLAGAVGACGAVTWLINHFWK